MDDFNYVLFSKEKDGGAPISPSILANFRNCLLDTGLFDLPSFGLTFTWSNMQHSDPIRSKLDRVLCNSTWLQDFLHSYYKITGPRSSDHSPITTVI